MNGSNSPWHRAIAPARVAFYVSGLHAVPRRLGAVRGCAVWMYHSVSEALSERRYPYAVTPKRFEGHLRFLRRRGIPILPLEDVAAMVREGRSFDRLSAAIAFDDGWQDNAEVAYPLLERYEAPATIFVTAAWIGRAGVPISALADVAFDGPAMIGWEDLRRIAAGGLVTIGSHGLGHIPLAPLSAETAWREADESKRRIEEGIGRPITLFSYPAGRFDDAAKGIVREAGYAAAFSSHPRPVAAGDDVFALGRFDAARYSGGPSRPLAALLNRSYFATALSLGR